MSRVLGLSLLLVAAAVGAYLYAAQSQRVGPTANSATRAEAQAESVVAGTNFRGADESLQAWYAETGTYAGAVLPPGSGVVLVRADARSYCLQTATGATVEHELGPGGPPQPGSC